MDRNYHGAPRIARLIESTHMLIRLKSDIPLGGLADPANGSYRAELSGDGATVEVRVIEYWVTVEGQEVPEMFSWSRPHGLGSNTPAPARRALRMAWDGSGPRCARRRRPARRRAGYQADAPLRVPEPGPAGDRRLGPLNRDDRSVILDAAVAASPPARTPRQPNGPAPRPVLRPRAPGGPVRRPPGHDCYQAVTAKSRGTGRRRPRPAPRPEIRVPSSFPHANAKDTATRIAPAVVTMADPSLNSGNTENQAEGTPPARGPGRPGRHAVLRHARQRTRTRSNRNRTTHDRSNV